MNEREQRVRNAWSSAYDEIGVVYPNDGEALLPALQASAPAIAAKIEEAESSAEAISTRWVNGGPGGVQAAINIWRDTWRDAIEFIRHGRD